MWILELKGLKEGIVLNIFYFITQNNIILKRFHGKKYLKLLKSLLSSGWMVFLSQMMCFQRK